MGSSHITRWRIFKSNFFSSKKNINKKRIYLLKRGCRCFLNDLPFVNIFGWKLFNFIEKLLFKPNSTVHFKEKPLLNILHLLHVIKINNISHINGKPVDSTWIISKQIGPDENCSKCVEVVFVWFYLIIIILITEIRLKD